MWEQSIAQQSIDNINIRKKSLVPYFEDKKLHGIDNVAAQKFCVDQSDISDINSIESLYENIEDFRNLVNPLVCDEKYLPYLAYAFKVDFWDDSLELEQKRKLIKNSILLHQKKGTVWAIEEVLRLIGFTNETTGEKPEVREGLRLGERKGRYTYNGVFNHNSYDDWSKYIVSVQKPITINEAKKAKKLIEKYAPIRSKLASILYQNLVPRDNTFYYNFKVSHGGIGNLND